MINVLIWTWAIATAAKLMGAPILRDVDWKYFLILPIIAIILRGLAGVIKFVGTVLIGIFTIDFMLYGYNHWLSTGDKAGTYVTLFRRMMGWIWDGFMWLVESGWEALTGLF